MSMQRDKQTKENIVTKLAIEGGSKAVPQLGPYTSKIHKEELEEILDLWEFAPA